MAWKGYDFGIINELHKEDYIRQGSHRSRFVTITDEGMKLSWELLAKYNILDWEQISVEKCSHMECFRKVPFRQGASRSWRHQKCLL